MKKIFSLMCIVLILMTFSSAYAENIKSIFEGEQDYLILGTVNDVSEGVAVVTVDNTVGEKSPSIIGKDIKIEKFAYSYCQDHTPSDFNNPKIGDNIFASISEEYGKYFIRNGAYKVDSSEVKNCSTLVYQSMKGEECLDDAVEIAYFIRSNGKITDFKAENGKVYAINDGEEILVYPIVGNQCVRFVDEAGKLIEDAAENDVMPIVPEGNAEAHSNDRRWIGAAVIFIGGAALGFLILFLVYAKKRV